jgi:hypothetical protein
MLADPRSGRIVAQPEVTPDLDQSCEVAMRCLLFWDGSDRGHPHRVLNRTRDRGPPANTSPSLATSE